MDFTNKKINFEGELALIPLQSCTELGKKIDKHIIQMRKEAGLESPETFIVQAEEIRFSNGEGKTFLKESIRGKDAYIICDIGNYSCTYTMHGYEIRMGPDEHFRDIKRIISAIGGRSARLNVVTPLLYSSRQDRNKGRESMDCAIALQELQGLGVRDIIAFDVHNSSVQNAIPLVSFENLYATYEVVRAFIEQERDMLKRKDDLLIISPDVGGMERAVYYSYVMQLDVGMFYKRRDYSRVVKGRNPIVEHTYLGQDVLGKSVIIIDDMIATGESIVDIVHELVAKGADKIFAVATFSFFTHGIERFDKLYEDGHLRAVYSTNLSYVPQEILDRPWFRQLDLSTYAAKVINNLNMNCSIEPIINSTENLKDIISKLREEKQ